MSRPPAPVRERFEAKVDRSGGPDACHPWTGCTVKGYGKFGVGLEGDGSATVVRAHQWAYEDRHGPIPLGPNGRKLSVDHECHNRAADRGECAGGPTCLHRRCCNPRHLRVLPSGENALASPLTPAGANTRKTHCKRGHPLSGGNLYVAPDGARACRQCRRERTS